MSLLAGFVCSFSVNSRDKLDIYVTSKDDVTNKMFVFFCKEDSIGVKPVRTYLDRMEKEKVHRSIIVVKAGITPYAKQILQGLQTQGYHVEQFKEDELLVNITKHVLVCNLLIHSPSACPR